MFEVMFDNVRKAAKCRLGETVFLIVQSEDEGATVPIQILCGSELI